MDTARQAGCGCCTQLVELSWFCSLLPRAVSWAHHPSEGSQTVCCGAQRPGRRYSYKVAHGSVVNGFQAPPPVGRKEGFSFLVYGDMGDPHHRKAKAPGCAS